MAYGHGGQPAYSKGQPVANLYIFGRSTCMKMLTQHGTIKNMSGAGMAMPCPFGRGFAGIAYGKAHGTNKKRSGLKKCQVWPLCALLQHDHMHM